MLINLKTIGILIKQNRLCAGFSQAEFSKLAAVSRATLSGIENGTIKEVGVNRLNRILSVSARLPSKVSAHDEPGRKSENLNLSFPYDWSNPLMKDDVLIRKVVERGLFEDMVRIAIRFGVEALRDAVLSFASSNRFAEPGLRRMMGNIERAFKDA